MLPPRITLDFASIFSLQPLYQFWNGLTHRGLVWFVCQGSWRAPPGRLACIHLINTSTGHYSAALFLYFLQERSFPNVKEEKDKLECLSGCVAVLAEWVSVRCHSGSQSRPPPRDKHSGSAMVPTNPKIWLQAGIFSLPISHFRLVPSLIKPTKVPSSTNFSPTRFPTHTTDNRIFQNNHQHHEGGTLLPSRQAPHSR